MPAAFWNIGSTELLVILVIALLLFGSRLPQVARSLGKSVNEFKKGVREVEDDVRKAGETPPAPPPQPATPQDPQAPKA